MSLYYKPLERMDIIPHAAIPPFKRKGGHNGRGKSSWQPLIEEALANPGMAVKARHHWLVSSVVLGRFAQYCHEHNIKNVKATVRGAFVYVWRIQ